MVVYKIRRKSDGLFSTGGIYPKFTSLGRFWKRKSDLHQHLFSFVRYWKNCSDRFDYLSCDIVEVKIYEETRSIINLSDYVHQIKKTKGII